MGRAVVEVRNVEKPRMGSSKIERIGEWSGMEMTTPCRIGGPGSGFVYSRGPNVYLLFALPNFDFLGNPRFCGEGRPVACSCQ